MSNSNALIVPGQTSAVLTMPTEDFLALQSQPIQDDSWIRTEDIVKMEHLIETEDGQRIKQQVLKDYVDEMARSGTTRHDPILEGMMYQEEFMKQYQRSERTTDTSKASSYKQRLVEEFRRSRDRQ